MHATHQSNSDFQQEFFVAGARYTPDGKWLVLYAQRQAARRKVVSYEAQGLERQAAALDLVDAEKIHQSPADRLRHQARRMNHEAGEEEYVLNLNGAREELATIERLMAELEPHRKYAHLSPIEISRMVARDEWRLELMNRVENFLLGEGRISWDHLNAMRQHPDFATHIGPHISLVTQKMHELRSHERVLAALPPLAIEGTPE